MYFRIGKWQGQAANVADRACFCQHACNDTRAIRVAQLTRDALRNMGKIVAASNIALLGASYREDVGDTRYSGSEIIVRKLTPAAAGGCVPARGPSENEVGRTA